MTHADAPTLTLTLRGDDTGVREVAHQWTPLPVERLLVGQPAGDAGTLLPAALALCRHAQCAAAQWALDAAQPGPLPASHPERDAEVRLEAARETLRRWLLDFPAVFGESWATAAIGQWSTFCTPEGIAAFCNEQVFGTSAAHWLTLDAGGQQRWAAHATTVPARWLRALLQRADRPAMAAAAGLLRHAGDHARALLDHGAHGRPPLHAELWDTPTLLPDLASGLLLARLRRLAQLCTADSTHAAAPASGGWRVGDIGVGWARAARGLLVHLARVGQGRVVAYRIIAPTWWNFGTGGLLQHALKDRPWPDAVQRAGQLTLLLDPCVQYEIGTLRHA